MDFEWDQAKSDVTYEQRGFDFAYAIQVFLDDRRLEREDTRRDYGERRYQAIGEIEGRFYFVVYARRDRRFRIISARRAHSHEDRAYRESKA